jgi:hypothetical protein
LIHFIFVLLLGSVLVGADYPVRNVALIDWGRDWPCA